MKYIFLILTFILTHMTLHAQQPGDMPKERLDMIKKFSYELGHSFFSKDTKETLSTKVDEEYELPWAKINEVNETALEEILVSIEKSMTWNLQDYFDGKALAIVTTYVNTNNLGIDFNKNFKIEIVKHKLINSQGTVISIDSNTPFSLSTAKEYVIQNDIQEEKITKENGFNLNPPSEKISGLINLNIGFLSGYETVMLTSDQVGHTFKFNANTYKLLELHGAKNLA